MVSVVVILVPLRNAAVVTEFVAGAQWPGWWHSVDLQASSKICELNVVAMGPVLR